MKPEETIDHPIRMAWNKISRIYNQEALQYDSSMTTGFILLKIDQENGTPSTRLGPMLGLEPRSLVRTLATMEEKGLITRNTDPHDKRMVRIFLTELGREKRKISREAVIHFNEFIQNKIPPQKLKVFFEVLGDINELLDQNEIFGKKNLNPLRTTK